MFRNRLIFPIIAIGIVGAIRRGPYGTSAPPKRAILKPNKTVGFSTTALKDLQGDEIVRIRATGAAVAAVMSVVSIMTAWAIAGRVRGGEVSEQIFATTSRKTQTSSPRWKNITGLSLISDCNNDVAASADVSLQLRGASRRVAIRVVHDGYTVRGDEPLPMRPRSFVLNLRGPGPSMHHLMFVKTRVTDQHGERFRVQWRSLDSRDVVLTRGALRLLWNPTEEMCA